MHITRNKRINKIYPLLNNGHYVIKDYANKQDIPFVKQYITRNKRINKIYPLLNNAHYA